MSAPTWDSAQRWRIGAITVTAVVESDTALAPAFVQRVVLPDATPERLRLHPWLAPHWVTPDWEPRMTVQALVVDTGQCRIVVDTCIGNHKPHRNEAFRLDTPFLERLHAAGYRTDGIEYVVCTHLHFDHIGWNTYLAADGQWRPTFGAARLLLADAEWARYAGQRAEWPDHVRDSVGPLLDAGLVDRIALPHEVTPGVTLVPTPGHTPGHASVRIESDGQRAFITGDMIHHPCQLAQPHWTSPADSDREQAQATREAFLAERAAAGGDLVIGTHFCAPAAGRVVPCGDAYRFDPDSKDA